jgi:hypothetical protein
LGNEAAFQTYRDALNLLAKETALLSSSTADASVLISEKNKIVEARKRLLTASSSL